MRYVKFAIVMALVAASCMGLLAFWADGGSRAVYVVGALALIFVAGLQVINEKGKH